MKINIPTEEEYQESRKRKRIQAVFGFIFGVIFFAIAGTRIFRYGLDAVEIYTWIALGFGVLSFTILAWKFGDTFWQTLIGRN